MLLEKIPNKLLEDFHLKHLKEFQNAEKYPQELQKYLQESRMEHLAELIKESDRKSSSASGSE